MEFFQEQLGGFKLLFEMKAQLVAGSASDLCLPLVPKLGGLNAFFFFLAWLSCKPISDRLLLVDLTFFVVMSRCWTPSSGFD